MLAAVGPLQFEVVSARLADEFAAPIKLDRLDYTLARRTDADGAEALKGSVGIEVLTLDLDLFFGKGKSSAGKRGALYNRAAHAADQIASGNYSEALALLGSLLDRVDGESPPKDWIEESHEKEQIAEHIRHVMLILEYLIDE